MQAYLNLENSGRELESIVVGEIQKAYNALASILKREADEMYSTIDQLRNGPIGMPRDLEWNKFVTNDPHFVNPNLPLRRLEDIEYPGKDHPATTEVRAGMLERKSKYLKSYTPGWSVSHLYNCHLLTILGMFYRLLIFMNSSRPTAYIRNPLSCPCTFPTRSLDRIPSLGARHTSLCSKAVRLDRCIEVTRGCSGPRATTPCWHGTKMSRS